MPKKAWLHLLKKENQIGQMTEMKYKEILFYKKNDLKNFKKNI